MRSAIDRLLAGCREDDRGCWVFTGGLTRGYSQVRTTAGKNGRGHRVSWEHFMGEIPTGLDLDHLCRNRACVNPWHLEPVTRSVNLRRGQVGRYKLFRSTCPQGHAYDIENTHIRPDGARSCRACRRQWNTTARLKKDAA